MDKSISTRILFFVSVMPFVLVREWNKHGIAKPGMTTKGPRFNGKSSDLARDAYLEKVPGNTRKILRVLNFKSMSLVPSKELETVLFDRLIEQLYPGTTSTTIVDQIAN